MNFTFNYNLNEAQLVELKSGFVFDVRQKFDKSILEKHGTLKGPGLYTEDDWARLHWIFYQLPKGETILDVGIGGGQFFNILHLSNQFKHVVGIDLKKHSKLLLLSRDMDFREMSVANLKFGDKSFDIVICMEVLEHINNNIFDDALSEIRRVARGKLIITIPFQEPEPLPKQHKRRFDIETVNRLFPEAKKTVLFRIKKKSVPWLLIEEDPC
jgi:2-polyprenyl-3-methyl-5-hydroxy-6-metoxy-1,4-benzoquinol methylase